MLRIEGVLAHATYILDSVVTFQLSVCLEKLQPVQLARRVHAHTQWSTCTHTHCLDLHLDSLHLDTMCKQKLLSLDSGKTGCSFILPENDVVCVPCSASLLSVFSLASVGNLTLASLELLIPSGPRKHLVLLQLLSILFQFWGCAKG